MSDPTTPDPQPSSAQPEISSFIANQSSQEQIPTVTTNTDTMQTPTEFYEKQAALGSAGTLPANTDGNFTNTASSTVPNAAGSPAQPTPAPAVAPAGSPAPQPVIQPSTVPAMPTQAAINGSPTRQWVNEKLTQHVLDAMKEIARARPEKPLLALSQFLATRSQEVEGPGAGMAAPADEKKEDVEEEMKDAE